MGNTAICPPPLFSDATIEQAWIDTVKEKLANHEHPAPYLPNFGVGFDMKNEAALKFHIKSMPIDQMAEYCDLVCRVATKDPDYIKFMETSDPPSTETVMDAFRQNVSSLCNCAYMALYAPDESTRNKYLEYVTAYQTNTY